MLARVEKFIWAICSWVVIAWVTGYFLYPYLQHTRGASTADLIMDFLIPGLLVLCLGIASQIGKKPRDAGGPRIVPNEGYMHRELVREAMQRQQTRQQQEEEERRQAAEARERQRQNDERARQEREQWQRRQSRERDQQRSSGTSSGTMTIAEALEILGLKAGASKQEIRTAYLNLIKKVHADQGGSDFLAKQVNAARDTLRGYGEK